MNDLLPSREELKPIEDTNNTFYDCVFNKDFDLLPFKKQLQIVNDIVRQSMLSNPRPDVYSDVENMEGNCHTASLVSMEYLKQLGLGKNIRCCLVRRRKFDPEDVCTMHSLVLVDDDKGNTYQFDATPFVGYKYGSVERMDKERFYDEYVVVDEDINSLINIVKEIINNDFCHMLDVSKISYYEQRLLDASQYPILNSHRAHCYNILSKYKDNISDANKLVRMALELNPYDRRNKENFAYKRELVLKQVKIWEEELIELRRSNKNLKRQLELCQCIVQEMKFIDPSFEKFAIINGEKIRLSFLSPRFFMENNYNVVIIKASAYRLGVRGTIRESFLKRGNGVVSEYFANFAKPTEDTHVSPMLFSHPLGEECIRSMDGPADVLLLQRNVEELYDIKKRLRGELGQNIINREVTWFDGEKILWHPFVTNLVHSTDNPSESCLHFLMSYPEHQLMTRFMYPNLKLLKKVK